MPHALSLPAMRFFIPSVNLATSPSVYPPTHGISEYFPARPIRNIEDFPYICDVWKNNIAVTQVLVRVELFLQLFQRRDVVETLRRRRLCLGRLVRRDDESGHREREQVIWKLGVEDEKRLAWYAESELHPREDNKTLLSWEQRAVVMCFFLCGFSDILRKEHVVMIRYRDALEVTLTAGLNQLPCVGAPPLVRHGVLAGPVNVAGCVNLEIATEEMRALVTHGFCHQLSVMPVPVELTGRGGSVRRRPRRSDTFSRGSPHHNGLPASRSG